MQHFITYLRFILIAALAACNVNVVLAQVVQKPSVISFTNGKVVNLAEVAAWQNQNPGNARCGIGYLKTNTGEHPVMGTGRSTLQQNNSLRGSSDSITASPRPLDTFQAQYYDNYTPCDPNGAVSANYAVSFSRYQLVVQERSGIILSQVNPYYIWASALSIEYIWPNRVEYDPYTNRWLMACFADEGTDTAAVLVGISQTDDPRGNWNLFKVLADSSGNTYPDFPSIGFNKNLVAITGARYYLDGTEDDTSFLFVFDKNAMINNTTVTCATFGTNDPKNSVAVTYDTTINNLYILAEWNNNVGQLELMKITGDSNNIEVSAVTYPTSNIPYIGNPANDDFAPQLGSNSDLEIGNDRPTSLVYANGNLWCAQTVFLPYDSATRSSIQWWQIDTSGNILQLGLIDDSTNNLFYGYPSIAVNENNDALIGYSVFSPQIYASCGYSYHDHNQAAGVADSSYLYKAGLNTYFDTINGGENYWGHLSATVVDPTDNLGFWTIQSFAASTVNTWGAQWARVDNYVTGINNIAQANTSISIFPNPTTGNFSIEMMNIPNTTIHIKLLDMLGRSVYEETTSSQTNIVSIVAPALAKGVYLVQVSANNQASVQKLVIE